MVVHTFVIEPTWNSESAVASTPVALLSTPAAASITSPRHDTATAAPGTWYSASNVASLSSSHFWISLRVAIPEP